jgi:hypothetical protein
MADAEFVGILAEMDLNDELAQARMQVTEQDYNHGGSWQWTLNLSRNMRLGLKIRSMIPLIFKCFFQQTAHGLEEGGRRFWASPDHVWAHGSDFWYRWRMEPTEEQLTALGNYRDIIIQNASKIADAVGVSPETLTGWTEDNGEFTSEQADKILEFLTKKPKAG